MRDFPDKRYFGFILLMIGIVIIVLLGIKNTLEAEEEQKQEYLNSKIQTILNATTDFNEPLEIRRHPASDYKNPIPFEIYLKFDKKLIFVDEKITYYATALSLGKEFNNVSSILLAFSQSDKDYSKMSLSDAKNELSRAPENKFFVLPSDSIPSLTTDGYTKFIDEGPVQLHGFVYWKNGTINQLWFDDPIRIYSKLDKVELITMQEQIKTNLLQEASNRMIIGITWIGIGLTITGFGSEIFIRHYFQTRDSTKPSNS